VFLNLIAYFWIVKKNNNIAVITGDLVSSSAVISIQFDQMNEVLKTHLEKNQNVLLPLTFFRGDSFQLMVKAEKSAEIALTIQSIILWTTATWARISIGIGAVSKIDPGNVLQSEGEAFQLSGHQLDSMKKEGRLFKIASNSPKHQPMLEAASHLADKLISGWKQGQASVVAMATQCSTQKEIAERLKISNPAVSKALKSANWPAFETFLKSYEQTIKMI
jgi:hypothetical protein